jgi:hypothetical protein
MLIVLAIEMKIQTSFCISGVCLLCSVIGDCVHGVVLQHVAVAVGAITRELLKMKRYLLSCISMCMIFRILEQL